MAARTSMAKPIATARAMEPILGIGFPFNFCQTCASLSMANTTSRVPLPVATPAGALALARTVLARHFVEQSPIFIESVFARVQERVAGSYPGYQACDTRFHDLTHTCD